MLTLLILAQLATTSAGARASVTTPVAPLKMELSPALLPGCDSTALRASSAPRDVSTARRLLAEAQDAALQGDRARARGLLETARQRDPQDERIALELSRVEEESGERSAALVSSCRGLVIATSLRVRDELSTRRERLVPPSRRQRALDAQARFEAGLSAAEQRQWRLAADAFSEASRLEPSAPEPAFNEGVTLILAGRRADAILAWERYLALAPGAPDRVEVARSFAPLRRPVFRPGAVLASGLFPGGGQFATNRFASGVLVLAVVAGAGVVAAQPVERERVVAYLDPNGQPVPYRERYTTRPYVGAALGGAVAATVIAALEARAFAAHSAAPIRLAVQSAGRDGMRVGATVWLGHRASR